MDKKGHQRNRFGLFLRLQQKLFEGASGVFGLKAMITDINAFLTLAAKQKATFALSQGFSFGAVTGRITIARGMIKFFMIVKKHENNEREIT